MAPVARLDISGRALQRPDTRLLIYGNNKGVRGRIEIPPDDICGLCRKLRICADTPASLTLQADTLFAENTPNCVVGSVQAGGQRRAVPSGLARRRGQFSCRDKPIAEVFRIQLGLARTRTIVQALQAFGFKTLAPVYHGVGTNSQVAGDFDDLFAGNAAQNDPGPFDDASLQRTA